MTTMNGAVIDTETTTEQLLSALHRGGAKWFGQIIDGGKRRSSWFDVGEDWRHFYKHFAVWQSGHNVYFGVNPTTVAVTDSDRAKYTKDGKTPADKWIQQYVGSKNHTIAVTNCVFSEFDGKDETAPTDAEIQAEIAGVRSEKQAMLASGELVKMPGDSAIYNEAVGRAKQTKYLTDPKHYNALALKRLESAPLSASVAWCSGGGYQAVWLLAEAFVIDNQEAREFIQWLQGAWVAKVGGDPGAKDIRRILRLPGTQNVKKHWAPNFPIVTYIKADFSVVYSIDQFVAVVPPRPPKETAQHRTATTLSAAGNGGFSGDSVIDAFNEAYKVTDILDDNGYTGTGLERSRPGQPGSNGVNISEDGRYSWHWSSNDPLHETNAGGNPRRVDAFKAFLVLEHHGNLKEAVKAAARMVGMDYKSNGNPEALVKPTGGKAAIWRNGSYDEPVVITGIMGEQDGEQYYSVEGSSTGIPASQIIDTETGEIADLPLTDQIQAFLDEAPAAPTMTLAEIKAAVDAKVKRIEAATNEEQREIIQRETIALVAQVTDAYTLDSWARVLPDKLGLTKSGYKSALRNERAAIEEKQAEAKAKVEAARAAAIAAKLEQLQQDAAPHPYVFHEGMIQIFSVSVNEETGEETETYSPICTFTAQIVGEIRDEFDNITYKIEGVAVRGGTFATEVDTDTFGSPSKLKIALEAAVGALDTVFSKMETHLGPAIKLLSVGVGLQRFTRYDRTGWVDGKFYLPGREPEGVRIELPKVLPYCAAEIVNADRAVQALSLLMKASPATVAPILLSSTLGPPIAALAGLSNHRYATMHKGQTGTYKTGRIMAYMAMWGAGFLDKDNLIKWGSGATSNAVMHLATSVHDLPKFIDNYKSNTDRGERGFVETIHAIMEGGEKLRLVGKVNKLRDVRDIQAWPICTGEDMPQGDPATLARFLVVPAKKDPSGVPDGILLQNAKHLPQVGSMLLDWLESEAGKEAAALVIDKFTELQRHWRNFLVKCNQGMPNVDRVASTLAINQAVFIVLTKHPTFGEVLLPYLSAHIEGLAEIAEQMSGTTTDGLEAYRLVAAIREMLSTGRAILIQNRTHYNGMPVDDRNRIIGWADGAGGAYLYPATARMMVEKIMGMKLSDMSDNAIGNQLSELGWLGSYDKGRFTKSSKISGIKDRYLHISARGLLLPDDEDLSEAEGSSAAAQTDEDEDGEII